MINLKVTLGNLLLLTTLWLLPAVAGLSQPSPSNPLINEDVTTIAAAYGIRSEYTIRRNGKKIGTHVLSFSTTDNKLQVTVDSKIKVRILGIPVYSLTYRSNELWSDNQLESAFAQTTENGVSSSVTLEPSNADTKVRYASNHWHPGVLQSLPIFNTLTGDIDNVTVIPIGNETITSANLKIDSFRFRYTYEQPVDSWYDNKGLWLKLQFSGKDGSVISYLRDNKP